MADNLIVFYSCVRALKLLLTARIIIYSIPDLRAAAFPESLVCRKQDLPSVTKKSLLALRFFNAALPKTEKALLRTAIVPDGPGALKMQQETGKKLRNGKKPGNRKKKQKKNGSKKLGNEPLVISSLSEM